MSQSNYRTISYVGGFEKAWKGADEEKIVISKCIVDYNRINLIGCMTVQFYALSYLCGDSGLTRSRSSPMLDSKVIRDIFHLFVYGHKRKKESGVSIEVSKLLLTVFDQN